MECIYHFRVNNFLYIVLRNKYILPSLNFCSSLEFIPQLQNWAFYSIKIGAKHPLHAKSPWFWLMWQNPILVDVVADIWFWSVSN